MIRDRKMYVAPTPFALAEGIAHTQTLILPEEFQVPKEFQKVGELKRKEADNLIVGYSFDLRTNNLRPRKVENPSAGKEHSFFAWRTARGSDQAVSMRKLSNTIGGYEESSQDE